jgi:hypothetical protein
MSCISGRYGSNNEVVSRRRRAVPAKARPGTELANNIRETYESANVPISDLLGWRLPSVSCRKDRPRITGGEACNGWSRGCWLRPGKLSSNRGVSVLDPRSVTSSRSRFHRQATCGVAASLRRVLAQPRTPEPFQIVIAFHVELDRHNCSAIQASEMLGCTRRSSCIAALATSPWPPMASAAVSTR